jgi:tetratricopeptide (TPR) repeat protein
VEHLTNADRGRSATRGALAALPLALALTTACARRVEERAPALFESATAALRRGDIARAESDLRLGEQLTHAEPASEWAWRFRFLEGDVVLARRELDLAAKLADADGAIPMPDVPELRARRQYLLARIQYVQSHLPRAFEVASIALPDAPPNSELKLEIDGFLGQVGLQLGKWAESEARLDGVVSAASASGHHDVEGMALVTQGMGKFIRNRCDEALPFFERAVALKDVAGTPIQGKALYNSGMCYARLGQFDRAIDVQRRAVTVLEIRPTSGDYEQALGQLGITYLLQGQVQEGLDYVQRAFTVATQAHIATDASLWAGNLAKAYIDLQRWDDAERFNEEARQIGGAAGGVRAAYRLEYSAFIAAGRRQFDEAVRLYQQVLASRDAPPSVLWHAHDGLAHVAVAKKEPRVAAREFEAALDVIEKTRAGLLRDDYKLSYLTELIDFYRAYVSELVAQKNITRALEIADSSRGRVLAERQRAAAPPRASVAALRRLASAAGTVFLSYWLTPSSSLMWVVAGDDVRQFVLPPSDEIDTMVREYQAAIGNALVDPLASRNTAGDALYRTLIAPAARFLRPGARLVIVADGSLHSLNFDTISSRMRRFRLHPRWRA